jgi:hypothetical protein
MLFKEIIDVYTDNHTENIGIIQNAAFLLVKADDTYYNGYLGASIPASYNGKLPLVLKGLKCCCDSHASLQVSISKPVVVLDSMFFTQQYTAIFTATFC